MRISELAKLSGASIKALRLYESKQLLPPVPRTGKYRDYQPVHLEQVRLIRQAQALGFKLSELQHIQQDEAGFNWAQLLQLMRGKQQQIVNTLSELQALHDSLEEIICELETCPIASSSLQACSEAL
jgi:DNA-binding transcriptional MerR regulator